MPTQRSQKQSLTSEEHRFQISGTLDTVINPWRKGDDATCIDPQRFAFQLSLDHRPASVKKGFSVAFQLLENKSLATKEADSESLVECNRHLGALRGTEKRILLTGDLPTHL